MEEVRIDRQSDFHANGFSCSWGKIEADSQNTA